MWLSEIAKTVKQILKTNWGIAMFIRILMLKKNSYKNWQKLRIVCLGILKKGCNIEKKHKYFSDEFKNITNLGKLNLRSKIHKHLFDVPGRPVISNCGTATEKVSEFLDHVLKSIMQQKGSYIKDSGDFIKKLKEIKEVANDAIMVTADVFGHYPIIRHDVGLEALRKTLDERVNKKMVLRTLIKWQKMFWKITTLNLMVKLNNNFLATAIGTKFAPSYACIFMEKVEIEFLESQVYRLLVWFRYIDDVFLLEAMVKKSLGHF